MFEESRLLWGGNSHQIWPMTSWHVVKIPDNTISRNCGGAWCSFSAALRVYNLTIIPRLWFLDVWLRTWRCAENRFRKFNGDLKKNEAIFSSLFTPWKRTRLDSTDITTKRWVYPKFELTHETRSVSHFLRPEGYITPVGTNFRFFETERMYRNFGSHGRGNPAYTGSVSGTNSASLGTTSASTTQEQVGVLSFSWATGYHGKLAIK